MTDAPRAYSYIRLSTEGQLKGHGKQRQLQQSADYAKRHGFQLATEDQLEDKAISAFKGANVKAGALGRFLEDVESGRVPKGSYLLVESLDRLSRQEPIKALSIFLDIINAGINLVTLIDGREYRASQTKPEDLMFSIAAMTRAHDESASKSQRVSAAWNNKRTLASHGGRPLTRLCPGWLRLAKDGTRYEPIPERVSVVQSIFQDTVAGIGSYVIMNRLNTRKVPPFGRSNGWQNSYIAKILNNRAVLGEYQPCQLIEGRRKAVGEAIKNYFPRIIDDELFYRAQQSRSERRITGRGRKGEYLTNLFSGLATCAYCQSRIVVEKKGPPPKGGSFLVCNAAKRGMGCVTTGWRYEQFEASFLAFVERIDLPSVLNDADSEVKALDGQIQSLEGRKLALREESTKAYELIKINSIQHAIFQPKQ